MPFMVTFVKSFIPCQVERFEQTYFLSAVNKDVLELELSLKLHGASRKLGFIIVPTVVFTWNIKSNGKSYKIMNSWKFKKKCLA